MSSLEEAVRLLHEGKPVVFPTETVYGLGVASSRKQSASQIYNLKGRESNKPLSFHIARLADFDLSEICFSHLASFLVHRFWPGPLTLIVKTQNQQTIGYRFPKHRVARHLIELLGEPILATSANPSGKNPAVSLQEAKSYFGSKVPLYLDGGVLEFQEASTVLDLSSYPPKIVRRGAQVKTIEEAIQEFSEFPFTKKLILLVCTGNTCRSPMAEGWLAHYLTVEGLSDVVTVESCGTGAYAGVPPSQEAIEVMKQDGIDISMKRSRLIQDELIRRASYIFVMTEAHKTYILEQFTEAQKQICVLNIPDPVGLEKSVYESVYALIKEKLKAELACRLKS